MKHLILVLLCIITMGMRSCSGCSKVIDAGEPIPILLPAGTDMESIEDTLLWGYINARGEWVIEPMFEEAEQFSCGYASVVYRNRWCYTDTLGNLHYAPDTLCWADDFHDGFAHIGVMHDDGLIYYGVIDTTFTYLVPPVSDNVEGYEYEPLERDDNYFLNVGAWYCTADFDEPSHTNTFRWHTPDGEVVYEWHWPF